MDQVCPNPDPSYRSEAHRVGKRPLKVEVQRHGTSAVVRLHGAADIYDCEKIRKPLEDLAAEQTPVTVVDLSDMDFIGSAGLAAVVYGHLKNRHHHGQIRLVAPQANVLQVLQMTCLIKLFQIYDSVEHALAYIPAGHAEPTKKA